MRCSLFVLALCLAVRPAAADPGFVVGKPVLAPTLPDGTLIVRVVAGRHTDSVSGIVVTLVVAGVTQQASSDRQGRATFEHLAAGATAKVSAASKSPLAASESFAIPASGGVRVLLSTRRWRWEDREHPDDPVPDDDVPAGAVEVAVTYDGVDEPPPPVGVTVSLVGYAADDTVRVVQRRTDRLGHVRFTDLDRSGAVAYFALVQLPRNGRADQLMSNMIVLDDSKGVHLTLAAGQRSSTAPPLDMIGRFEDRTGTPPVARGTLRARFVVDNNASAVLAVRNVVTGKILARRTTTLDHEDIALRAAPGTIVVVETTASGITRTSLPVELVADRGTELSVQTFPRLVAGYELVARVDDDRLVVTGRLTISSYAWAPYVEAGHGPVFPLPRGATHAVVRDPSVARTLATITDGAIVLTRPLSPGGSELEMAFELPATNGIVAWSLDLPKGAFVSRLSILDERGLAIDQLSPGFTLRAQPSREGRQQVVDALALEPNTTMAMTIHLPAPGPANAVLHACRALVPMPTSLVDQSIDFTLNKLGGGSLRLSALRGKPALVNVMDPKNGLWVAERSQLAVLTQVTGLAVVMVASASDLDEASQAVGKSPFPVVLDPPGKADEKVGAVTRSWDILLLPDNLLVDRRGVVRFHFEGGRDWTTPDALRCVRAFAAAP